MPLTVRVARAGRPCGDWQRGATTTSLNTQSESNLRNGNPSFKRQLPQLQREGTHSRLLVGRAMPSPCSSPSLALELPCIHLVGIPEPGTFGASSKPSRLRVHAPL